MFQDMCMLYIYEGPSVGLLRTPSFVLDPSVCVACTPYLLFEFGLDQFFGTNPPTEGLYYTLSTAHKDNTRN